MYYLELLSQTQYPCVWDIFSIIIVVPNKKHIELNILFISIKLFGGDLGDATIAQSGV